MHSFLHKIEKYIEANSLFSPGDTVIVGVSGGADSVALLSVLHQLKVLRLKLVVAHLDHRLRGEESDEDVSFVARLSAELDLPFEMRSVDVCRFSAENGYTLEEGGRIVRHDFFRHLVSKHNADAIALGHHGDDQAETILMRLVRGAGAAGLVGMRAGGNFVRPLLCVSRREIEEYLRQGGILFRNDSSNTDTRHLRNRIRHELIPYLQTYNPSIRQTLITTADILSADEDLLESLTDSAFYCLSSKEPTCEVNLQLPALLREPKGMRFRIYRKAIQKAKGDLTHITTRHLQLIDGLVHSAKPNSKLTIPDKLAVTRTYEKLSFTVHRERQIMQEHPEMAIPGPGVFPLPGNRTLIIRLSSPPASWGGLPASRAFFDLQKAPFPWIVRFFRPGDRFNPLGMTGSKKLKDFFIDMKIPRDERCNIPLIAAEKGILWIGGLRASTDASVTSESSDVALAEICDICLK